MQKKQPASTQPMSPTSFSIPSPELSGIDQEILSKWVELTKLNEPLSKEEVIAHGIQIVQVQLVEAFYGMGRYQNILCLAFEFTGKGKHRKNHYHNVHHCYAVAKQCNTYVRSQYGPSIQKPHELALYLAALFHDYNHSGKSLSKVLDKHNINNAIIGLLTFQLKLIKLGFDSPDYPDMDYIIEQAINAIKSTMVRLVDGKVMFGKRPNNDINAILRDADVTMLLDSFGRSLNPGLAKELGLPYDESFKLSSINFLKKVKLYTVAANHYRKEYLTYLEDKMACTHS